MESGHGSAADLWRCSFETAHRERFGYLRPGRQIELKALRLRAAGRAAAPATPPATSRASVGASAVGSPGDRDSASGARAMGPEPIRWDEAWLPDLGRSRVPVFEREALVAGDRLVGPALILEATGTVVVDPEFTLEVDGQGVFRLRDRHQASAASNARGVDLDESDPVRLEVLGNRFMSIAEQMGAVLRNTSISTNIKERLDYSCAVFDRRGGLVANAPHVPVHLGAMADTVAAMRARFAHSRAGRCDRDERSLRGRLAPARRHGRDAGLRDRSGRCRLLRRESRPPRRSRRQDARIDAAELDDARGGGRPDRALPTGLGRVVSRKRGSAPCSRGALIPLGAGRQRGGSRRDGGRQSGGRGIARGSRSRRSGTRSSHVTMQQLQNAAASKVARELARLRARGASLRGCPRRRNADRRHAARRRRRTRARFQAQVDFEGTGPPRPAI